MILEVFANLRDSMIRCSLSQPSPHCSRVQIFSSPSSKQTHFSVVLLETKFCLVRSVTGLPDSRLTPGAQLLWALALYLLENGKHVNIEFVLALQYRARGAQPPPEDCCSNNGKWKGGKRWTQSTQHSKAKTHIAGISASGIRGASQVNSLLFRKLQQAAVLNRTEAQQPGEGKLSVTGCFM